jgi:hypothetical protein
MKASIFVHGRKVYFLLLAIPASCAFWFLYAIAATEIANWTTYRRLRNYKPEPSARSPQKRPKTIRGFDYPELLFEDTMQRIRELEKRIAECNREIESQRNK